MIGSVPAVEDDLPPQLLGSSEEEVITSLRKIGSEINSCESQQEIERTRSFLLSSARLTRAQHPSCWTAEVASELGVILRETSTILDKYEQREYIQDGKYAGLNGGIVEQSQTLLKPEDITIDIYDDTREVAMRYLREDESQHEVNMKLFLRTLTGWCFIFMACIAPWFITIGISLRELRNTQAAQDSSFTCGGIEKYLFGFLWLIGIHAVTSTVLSLSKSVDGGRSFISKRSGTVACCCSTIVIAYNAYGLVVVWSYYGEREECVRDSNMFE